jgi:hypothetical protein
LGAGSSLTDHKTLFFSSGRPKPLAAIRQIPENKNKTKKTKKTKKKKKKKKKKKEKKKRKKNEKEK